MKDTVTLKDIINILLKRKKFIFWFTFIGTIITIGITLILPIKYTSTASILPPSGKKTSLMGAFSSMLSSGLSSIPNIAQLGMSPSSPDIFAKILESVSIRKKIIDEFDLMKYFKVKYLIDALKALGSATNIHVTQEGIIEISVTLRDKKLAANIANAYIQELDKFNKNINMTQGRKYRIFVEKRLQDESKVLNMAENKLRDYQKKHKTFEVDEELKKIIDVYADLKANLIEKEIQKKAYEKISPTNPYTQYLEDEIAGVKKEIYKLESGKSSSGWGAGFGTPFEQIPDVYAELANLMKNVEIHQAIYEFLLQQYEQAKIEEAKDTPTVQFLDRATPSEKKSFPKRGKIVIATFIVLLIVSMIGVITKEYSILD